MATRSNIGIVNEDGSITGIYVHFDGYHFILSTERENGWHEIGLEPSVFDALLKYRKQVYEDAEKLKNDKK